MNLKINRIKCDNEGCFGEMTDDTGKVVAYTAEHAYVQPDGSWVPKTPSGDYTCKLGMHALHSTPVPFPAYEVENVPQHTDILLHFGNFPQKDSDGCFLLGEAIVPSSKGTMVTNSRMVFAEFMKLQDGIDSFQITIS